jgi:DNA-binding CsgD family transcriptional regulator
MPDSIAVPGVEAFARRVADAYNERDLLALGALWAPEGTFEATTGRSPLYAALGIETASPLKMVYQGREAVLSSAHMLFGLFPYFYVEPLEASEVPGHYMVSWSSLMGPSAQSAERRDSTILYRLAGGKIVGARTFATPEEARADAAGDAGTQALDLFRSAPTPMVLLNDAASFVDANAAASTLFGRSLDELRVRTLHDFASPEVRKDQEHLWRLLISEGRLVGELVLRVAPRRWSRVGFSAQTGYGDQDLNLVLLTPVDQGRPGVSPTDRLTSRERELMEMVARGCRGPEIAEQLCLSPDTVRTHLRNAASKLGARTRAEAVAIAIGKGEIDVVRESEPDVDSAVG